MRIWGTLSMRSQAALRTSLLLVTIAVLWPAGPVRAADNPVAEAARGGDLASIRELIDRGAAVNVRAGDGSTALLWAAYHSHPEMVQTLIAAGADPDTANNFGVTPLLQASRTGDTAVMQALLDGGADLELTHPEGETPLMAVSRTGRIDAVGLLLERGADPNAVESFQQQTALMWAAAEGHLDVVDVLLKAGADPNLQARVSTLTKRSINADYPSGGFTALMWAARNGYADVVGRLVEAGADLNLTNGDDATALMIAIVNDRFDLAATLLELGADVRDGSLYYAVEMRDATTDWYAKDGSELRANHDNELSALDLIGRLLEAGADPNELFTGQMHSATMCCDTSANASPFYRAAVAADVEALKLFIEHGVDLEWSPPKAEEGGGPRGNANVGRTPLMVAIKGGKGVPLSAGPGYNREGPAPFREPSNREPADAVRLLLEAGADPSAAMPDDATTALHEAVTTRNIDTIRALTEAGAALGAKNKDGLTALHVAEALPTENPENVFALGRVDLDGASPDEIAALLSEAMQAAGVTIEPAPEPAQDAAA